MTGPARRVIAAAATLAILTLSLGARRVDPEGFRSSAVDSIGFTVGNLDEAVAFYTGVLPFTKLSETEVSGRAFELLTGVFGARARVARLRLGRDTIELTQFLAPRGRPYPADIRPHDRAFQHIAIVVSDLEKAYATLRARYPLEHASTGPQRLPDWNPDAAGIEAFYFRDHDRHFLELIEFPPGKGDPRWQRSAHLFAGIDHTAIVVADTEASLRFYRDALGMTVAGESENHGVEQEHLNNVFGARLRITTLRATQGPGIELLEYLAPRDGRAAPSDLRANDIAHWQTSVRVGTLEPLLPLARRHRVALVSPGPVDSLPAALGFVRGALVRDPDGHAVRLIHD